MPASGVLEREEHERPAMTRREGESIGNGSMFRLTMEKIDETVAKGSRDKANKARDLKQADFSVPNQEVSTPTRNSRQKSRPDSDQEMPQQITRRSSQQQDNQHSSNYIDSLYSQAEKRESIQSARLRQQQSQPSLHYEDPRQE